jgi:hypothetical protein
MATCCAAAGVIAATIASAAILTPSFAMLADPLALMIVFLIALK